MKGIGLLILAGIAVAVTANQAGAATFLPDWLNPQPDPGSTPLDPGMQGPSIMDSSLQARIDALLATIRKFESGDRYNVRFDGSASGATFASFADHPRIKARITLGRYAGQSSDAAGAYQFLSTTWDSYKRKLSLPDFSPASQDAAAAAYLADLRAVDALAAGDVPLALTRASSAWASLPGSSAGQNPQRMDNALAAFDAALVHTYSIA